MNTTSFLGKTLKNGATVIKQNGRLVLAHWNKGRFGFEFIVWTVDDDGNADNGTYSFDLKNALYNFNRRAGYGEKLDKPEF